MKIIKFIASFLLFLGILTLMFWVGIKMKGQICTEISIIFSGSKNSKILTESDILQLLKQNNIEWEGKTIKDIELSSIYKILSQENYIISVNKVHFLGSKLQIDVTLYDILLEVHPKNGEKFLLDINGTYLPYSPKLGNDVIVVQGIIPNTYQKKETITFKDSELYELFSMASLIRKDAFYAKLFHKFYINETREIIFYPSVGKIPVLFGTIQDAANKLTTLKYMYEDVLSYMKEDKYAQIDVRFKNRIVATKSKS
jgi:hypothetical protein